ncbi:hypothetical protein [Streptomyces sp. 1222.5]|uniref:hypothetical protein n=1 Tax=Streptomyces sp. 1222.5 TaxID=1881026 RepID=UPI003EB92B71
MRYLVTQHAMLNPGELPPRADERPAWNDDDLRLTHEDIADLAEPDLAENTVINRALPTGSASRASPRSASTLGRTAPPYRRFTATAALHAIPDAFLEQAAAGAFIVAPVGYGILRATVTAPGYGTGWLLPTP